LAQLKVGAVSHTAEWAETERHTRDKAEHERLVGEDAETKRRTGERAKVAQQQATRAKYVVLGLVGLAVIVIAICYFSPSGTKQETQQTQQIQPGEPPREPTAAKAPANTDATSRTLQAPTESDLPFFMTRPVTEQDLEGKSAWELEVMRNEIFARHGRQFVRKDLQRYFSAQSWYVPRFPATQFPTSLLGSVQQKNVALILSYQKAHGLGI
jgi:serine/threonine-protein kinase